MALLKREALHNAPGVQMNAAIFCLTDMRNLVSASVAKAVQTHTMALRTIVHLGDMYAESGQT